MNRRLAWLAVLAALAASRGLDVPPQDPAPRVATRPPRVLLVGDNTFQNHYGNTTKALKGAAEVVRSPLGHLHTGAALERIDELLGDEPWDVIAFNFGLSDLMLRDPRTTAIRAMSAAAGGVPVTSAEDYATHLDALVDRLGANGTALVWTTTLPLSPRHRNGALDPDAVARYHAIAVARMQARGVAIVDTRGQIAAELAAIENRRGLDRHHNQVLKRDLSPPLVERIRELVQR